MAGIQWVHKLKTEKLGPAFNRLFSASAISNLADGLLAVAAPLLAITLTKNPVLISMLSALVMLPWLLFAIPIGLIVDRVDKRPDHIHQLSTLCNRWAFGIGDSYRFCDYLLAIRGSISDRNF